MKKKLLDQKNIYLIGLAFLTGLFLFISICTPLAGDDWCYAVNGMEGNPITKAFEFYQTWSGRFFSELWGFVVTNNKWAWNIINPLLFGIIYFCIYKLTGTRKNYLIITLLIISFILSVDDNVRMETYSWIMGTTYVVPLCVSLIYFYFLERVYLEKTNKSVLYFINPLLFIGSMMMENISASMVIGLLILIAYFYFNKKELVKPLLINLLICSVGFILMRSSNGSATRLLRDYPEWSKLGFIEKIIVDCPTFIQKTFIDNNYMIGLLSICLSCSVICSKRENKLSIKIVCLLINIIAIFNVFSFLIIKGDNLFIDGSSTYSTVFWPIYIVSVFVQICLFTENNYLRNKKLFFLMFGGSAALAMLMSPLYGARSSLYTIYYIILLSSLIISELDLNKVIKALLVIVLVGIVADRTNEYINKYSLVRKRTIKREEEIVYYQKHPEEDAGFLRFPIYTIHGIDVDWDDEVHLQAFSVLYDLPQGMDRIYFYYE